MVWIERMISLHVRSIMALMGDRPPPPHTHTATLILKALKSLELTDVAEMANWSRLGGDIYFSLWPKFRIF